MNSLIFLHLFVTIFWFGFVSAISFFESWLKFRAPGITLPVGLRVGKKVFNALNRVEWVLFMIVISLSLFTQIYIGLLVCIGITLFLQTCYLLPMLNHRADKIIAGETVAPSWYHRAYILSEITKLICLLVMATKIA